MPHIRSKINGHTKKRYYNPSPQSLKIYATALLKKIAQCLTIMFNVKYFITVKCSDSKYKKKDTKEYVIRHSRNVIQTTKNQKIIQLD